VGSVLFWAILIFGLVVLARRFIGSQPLRGGWQLTAEGCWRSALGG
jgi:hypothetical protein